jgi:hypothetical protein
MSAGTARVMTDPDDVDDLRAPGGERLPTGPGATAGLPGDNSADGGGLDVDDLDDTTLMGDVAPPGPTDVR